MQKQWWLAYDHAKYEAEDVSFLNVSVLYDAEGGNSTQTIITLDTENFGGNELHVMYEGSNKKAYQFETGRLTIKLYGSQEAAQFFEAMRNLIKAYDLRADIGD